MRLADAVVFFLEMYDAELAWFYRVGWGVSRVLYYCMRNLSLCFRRGLSFSRVFMNFVGKMFAGLKECCNFAPAIEK